MNRMSHISEACGTVKACWTRQTYVTAASVLVFLLGKTTNFLLNPFSYSRVTGDGNERPKTSLHILVIAAAFSQAIHRAKRCFQQTSDIACQISTNHPR